MYFSRPDAFSSPKRAIYPPRRRKGKIGTIFNAIINNQAQHPDGSASPPTRADILTACLSTHRGEHHRPPTPSAATIWQWPPQPKTPSAAVPDIPSDCRQSGRTIPTRHHLTGGRTAAANTSTATVPDIPTAKHTQITYLSLCVFIHSNTTSYNIITNKLCTPRFVLCLKFNVLRATATTTDDVQFFFVFLCLSLFLTEYSFKNNVYITTFQKMDLHFWLKYKKNSFFIF